MGVSFSGGASVGGGFFYSIPLAVSAFFVFYRKSLNKYLLYEGIGIALIALALSFSYMSKYSAGGGGISASASTKAGSGVAVLFFGGLIYTIGAVMYGRLINTNSPFVNKLLKYITHPLTRVILLGLLIFIPGINKMKLHNNKSELFFMGMFFGGLPLFISKKYKYDRFSTIATSSIFVFATALLIPRYSSNNILVNLSDAFYSITPWYFFIIMIVGGLALYADYLGSQSKTLEFAEKIKKIFNYKLIFGTFLAIFILLFTYNSITKHRLTGEEISAFNERNSKINGDWYFLDNDSSSVYHVIIDLNQNSYSENGDISFKYTSSLYRENMPIEEISNQEFSDTKSYSYELSFPLVFDKGLKIVSLSGDKINGSLILHGKEINFEAFRDMDYLNNMIQKKIDQMPVLVDTTNSYNTLPEINQEIQNNSSNHFTVKVDKAYFFNEPNFNSKRGAYLINGQSAEFTKSENNFVYVIFSNEKGQTTEGWISIDDISIY
jgi:hypothetical protein